MGVVAWLLGQVLRGQCLLRAVLGVVGRRLFGAVLPLGPEGVPSAVWLERVLHRPVLGVAVAPLGENRGLAGWLSTVAVSLADGTDLRLVLKTTPASWRGRYQCLISGSWREAELLRTVKTSAITPAVHHASSSWLFGSYVVLMEEVHGRGVNWSFGNQVWGSDPAVDISRDAQSEMLRKVCRLAAAVPAVAKGAEGAKWLKDVDVAQFQLAVASARTSWEKAKKREGVRFDPVLVRVIDRSLRSAVRAERGGHICHGDFHASNIIARSDGSLALVDWSEVGRSPLGVDVGQLLISDIRPEVRRDMEVARIVKEEYWDGLEHLEHRGTWEGCWEEGVVKGALERWVYVLPVLMGLNLPLSATQYFHDQVAAFFHDYCGDDNLTLKLRVVPLDLFLPCL
eukprot:Sspe_Gene.65947::Locus_38983_Transcript_1_1_Confidence_1.000_Length_1317::g.65947::m.65947